MLIIQSLFNCHTYTIYCFMQKNIRNSIREESILIRYQSFVQGFEKNYTYTPYIYAILSNINLVFMQIYLKYSSTYINPLNSLAIRGFFLFFFNFLIVRINNLSLDVKDPVTFSILLKRMFWASITIAMFLAPLKYLPAATVNALYGLSPIIISFVEAFRYKKSLNVKHIGLTVISFLGILLIIQPEFLFGESNESYSHYKYLMVFTCIAAFTNSIAKTYLHDLKGKISGTVVLQYFYVGQCLFNSVIMMFQEEDTNDLSLDWNFCKIMFMLTCTAYFVQMFSTRALMLKKPSYIMPFSYISIVFSTITDYFVFGNSFGTLSIVGILLTGIGLLIKLLISQEDQSKNIVNSVDTNLQKDKI